MRVIAKVFARLHKEISPISYAKRVGVRVGNNCRLIDVTYGSEPFLITIGDHVSITRSHFVTHDGAMWLFRDKYPDADLLGPITVGDNVFIGIGCTILPGVTIGDNVIIGAHSLVTRDIPSGYVAAGVPAKTIKTVEEYWEQKKDLIVNTKSMSASEKRKYYIKHFNLNDA